MFMAKATLLISFLKIIIMLRLYKIISMHMFILLYFFHVVLLCM